MNMHDNLRVLMIGDVVGSAGLDALERLLPDLIREERADFVTVNGENAADGFGISEETLNRILNAGADVVTSGNHVWEKRDFLTILDSEKRILRPANYPDGNAGHGWIEVEKNGVLWLVINLQGRELLYLIDCPFRSFDRILSDLKSTPVILVDFHAECTKEKECLAYYIDGRASLVVGTHTHVPTADERILPNGTGYISDLGMTGVSDSIIGMDLKLCLERVKTQVLYRMDCAEGVTSLQGVIAEIDRTSRKTLSISRVNKTNQ